MDSSKSSSPHPQYFLKGAILIILMVPLLKVPVTEGRIHGEAVRTLPAVASINTDEDIRQILLVLEARIGNQKALEKAKEKLETLDEKRTRLIANLCERVKASGRTAGGDISLLLASVLIILS